jgi:hypothetical protein
VSSCDILYIDNLEKFNAGDDYTDGIAETLRAIDSTEVAFVVKEVESKLTNTVDTFYSLFTNEWALAPRRVPANELKELKKMTYKRYRVIMRQCRQILKNKMSHEFIDTYLIALKQHRCNSILNPGDNAMTSTQMAFKMVRNGSMLKKLRKKSREQLTRRYKLS